MGKVQLPSHSQLIQIDRGLVELKADLDSDGAQRLIESMDVVAALADGQIDVEVIRSGLMYPVFVDYDKSVEQLLEAGHYGWVNVDVNDSQFPISGKGTAEWRFQLVRLWRDTSDAEVLAELDRCGLRSATNQELLAFGILFPDIQWKFPIVQRGSVWVDSGGRRLVSYLYAGLYAGATKRIVGTFDLKEDWGRDCRVLAIAQVSGI